MIPFRKNALSYKDLMILTTDFLSEFFLLGQYLVAPIKIVKGMLIHGESHIF